MPETSVGWAPLNQWLLQGCQEATGGERGAKRSRNHQQHLGQGGPCTGGYAERGPWREGRSGTGKFAGRPPQGHRLVSCLLCPPLCLVLLDSQDRLCRSRHQTTRLRGRVMQLLYFSFLLKMNPPPQANLPCFTGWNCFVCPACLTSLLARDPSHQDCFGAIKIHTPGA